MKFWPRLRSTTDVRAEAVQLTSEIAADLREMDFSVTRSIDGWRKQSRDHWLGTFEELREQLIRGDTDFEYLAHNLVRALDHDGVSEGQTQGRAAKLQADLLTIGSESAKARSSTL